MKLLTPKEEIEEKDIIKQVNVEIDKEAFRGPFSCCDKETKKIKKILSLKGIDFHYEVWRCPKCAKEYVDTSQAERLEKLWIIEKMLDDNLITIERHMNFDGKAYFFRFPLEFTKKWHQKRHVDIRLLTPDKYLVEVKS